jgi:hypothetical protein
MVDCCSDTTGDEDAEGENSDSSSGEVIQVSTIHIILPPLITLIKAPQRINKCPGHVLLVDYMMKTRCFNKRRSFIARIFINEVFVIRACA